MKRRSFILASGVALGAYASGARGQQSAKPLVGFVRSSSIDSVGNLVAAFRAGLKEAGYDEGTNVVIEFRSADDRNDRLPGIVADLVRRNASVLVGNTVAAMVAKSATTTIPIVFAAGGDAIKEGLVASYNRPGANLTGVSFLNSDLGAKKLEMLRYVVPDASVIGILENPQSSISRQERLDALKAADSVGQRTIVVAARHEDEFDAAFAALDRERPRAMLVTGEALFLSRRSKLVAVASRHSTPTIYSDQPIVAAGGLMSYGASITDAYRQVGVYTGRILKGEKPGDLPVLQPTKLEFVLNLKTAKSLGLSVPQSLLLRADQIVN